MTLLKQFNRCQHVISKIKNLIEGKQYALANDKTVTYFSSYCVFAWISKEF